MKIYFAGPLFSEAERDWIRATIREIESFTEEHGASVNKLNRSIATEARERYAVLPEKMGQ